MLDLSRIRFLGDKGHRSKFASASLPAVADQIGTANFLEGEEPNTPPEDGYPFADYAPGSSENRDREADRRGGPRGASDRLRIDGSFHLPGVPIWNSYPAIFQVGPVAGSPNGIDAAAGARRDRRGGVLNPG
jgi:hypothetical protein